MWVVCFDFVVVVFIVFLSFICVMSRAGSTFTSYFSRVSELEKYILPFSSTQKLYADLSSVYHKAFQVYKLPLLSIYLLLYLIISRKNVYQNKITWCEKVLK